MVRCLRARKPYIALVVKKRLSEGIGKEITQNKDEIAVFPPLISSENLVRLCIDTFTFLY